MDLLHRAASLRPLLLLTILLGATPATATEPPAPAQVLAVVEPSADATDTKAMQVGVLRFMAHLVGGMLAEEAGGDAALKQAGERYAQAAKTLEEATAAGLSDAGGDESPRARFLTFVNVYEGDALLRRRCAERFYSMEVLQRFNQWEAHAWERTHPTAANAEQERTAKVDGTHTDPRLWWWIPFLFCGLVVGICYVFVGRGLLREWRPCGIDPADPRCYRIGWRRFLLHRCTGVATGVETPVDVTRTSGVDPVGRSYNYTNVHQRRSFHIRERNGTERPFDMPDNSFSVRDGNVVSAVWAIEEGAERGLVAMFHNHQTNISKWMQHGMAPLVRYRRRTLVPLFIGTVFLMIMIILYLGAAEEAALQEAGAQRGGWFSQGALYALGWSVLWVPLLVTIVGWFYLRSITARRAKHLVNALSPHWVAGFREQAVADGYYAAPPHAGKAQDT